jgi:hypothetical protein
MAERLECKFASEGVDAKTGQFAGYGAIFGNVDTHGDVIVPGAFKETLVDWAQRGGLPAMKLMHGSVANPFTGSDLPIGRWTAMREDSRGLYVEGKLSGLDTDRGRFNYALMQDGALNALSIGFKALRFTRSPTAQIKRSLESVKLVEVSLVPEGSNDQALITDVKSWSDGELPTLPQFEDWLREAGRFSKTQATAIAGKGLSQLLRSESGSASDDVAAFLAALGAHSPAQS